MFTLLELSKSIPTPVLSDPCHVSSLKICGNPGTHTTEFECISFLLTVLLAVGLDDLRNTGCSRRKLFQSIATPSWAPVSLSTLPQLLVTFPVKGPPSSWLWFRATGPGQCLYLSKSKFLIPLALLASREMGLLQAFHVYL